MIRIAAVGDIHVGRDGDPALARDFAEVHSCADVLLIAGDLTRCGSAVEAEQLAEMLEPVSVPVVAVLGNHDHHADAAEEVTQMLEAAGVTVLEGTSTVVDVAGTTLGVAGTKGFGGGFSGASASDFGEPEMKAFVAHTKDLAGRLHKSLDALDTDLRVVLLHYSPVEATLHGERLEIYPFLGSYLLAEAIDASRADLVLHGHAHTGSERGVTPGGIRVRNVARPVIQRAFRLFELGPAEPAAQAS